MFKNEHIKELNFSTIESRQGGMTEKKNSSDDPFSVVVKDYSKNYEG